MISVLATSLAVMPALAYGLTTPGIENAPVAPFSFPDGDIVATEIHESSAEDTLMDVAEITLKDTYPRPTIPWLSHLPRPKLGSVPYGRVLTSCARPNTIALTFDDGPWKYTEDLLDLLGASGARATFFVCGGNMGGDGQLTRPGYPPLLRRMVREGHQVGTHTWGHADLAALDGAAVARQVLANEQALVQDLGLIPTYLRPPYFSSDDEALAVVGGLGYHVVNAGVDTRDWAGDYDAARDNFDEAVRDARGKIVLAHDVKERTAHELAEYMIAQAEEHGYRLVTVGECLGDPPRNWYRSPSTGKSWLARTRGTDSHGSGSGSGSGSGNGRDRGRGRGRGQGRGLVERAVVPLPDAARGNETSDPTATPGASSIILYGQTVTLPVEAPPTVVRRAEEAPVATHTEVPSWSGFDPCLYVFADDLEPWREWCCDRGYDSCPERNGSEVQEEAAAAAAVEPVERRHAHPPTWTSATVTTTTRAAIDADYWSVHTVIVGELCKRPGEECVPVYKTVTRIADVADRRPTGTTRTTTITASDHHRRSRGRRDHYPETFAAAIRAMPTTTVAFPSSRGVSLLDDEVMPPTMTMMARPVRDGEEGATWADEGENEDMMETDKRSVLADSHVVDDLTEELVGDMDDYPAGCEGALFEGEGQDQGQEAGEGQNHGEQQHQQEKEQEQEYEHHPAAHATTAAGRVPVTAGAVRGPVARWAMLLVVVANLCLLFR